MRILTTLTASLVLCTASYCPVVAADSTAAMTPEQTEKTFNDVIAALRGNDLYAAFKAMPPAAQAQAIAEWEAKKAEEDPTQETVNAQLQSMREPGAVDKMVAEYTPQLPKPEDLQQAIMGLRMVGAMAPALINPNGTKSEVEKQKVKDSMGTIVSLANGIAGWMETAPLGKPEQLREAVELVVELVNALPFQKVEDIKKFDLPEFLQKNSETVKKVKAIAKVYNLNADGFLDSLKVSITKNAGGTYDFVANFTAFGKAEKLWLPLVAKENGLTIDLSYSSELQLDALGGMIPLPGPGPGPGAGGDFGGAQ